MIAATYEAYAKLNLLLGVTPEVVAGKHLLTTVFVAIDLADTLRCSFDETRPRAITIETFSTPGIEPLDLPAERNIVHVAAETMEHICARRLQGRLHVTIEKRIPPQGGLAGGSADAAAALRFIAALWEMPPTSPRVLQAAETLGADVTFFLYGGCALMGGSGEKLARKLPPPPLDLVLVKPAGGIATSEAYRAFDADPQPVPSAQRLVRLLEATAKVPAKAPAKATAQATAPVSPELIAAALANNLYPAACRLMPELATLVDELKRQPGVHTALLAGSGSTVFGVCKDARAATQAAAHFAQKGYWSQPCTTRCQEEQAPH
jgi:4-diphosphocytidyl-2-C-methyl-D-erythritol kinase